MKIRVKVESRYVEGDIHYVTGLLVEENKITQTGPFMSYGLAHSGQYWSVVRSRLLSRGLILTEQMESD